jgi:hypothetical protein
LLQLGTVTAAQVLLLLLLIVLLPCARALYVCIEVILNIKTILVIISARISFRFTEEVVDWAGWADGLKEQAIKTGSWSECWSECHV